MTTRIKGSITILGEGRAHLNNVDVEGDIVVESHDPTKFDPVKLPVPESLEAKDPTSLLPYLVCFLAGLLLGMVLVVW